jgi:ribonuclease T1
VRTRLASTEPFCSVSSLMSQDSPRHALRPLVCWLASWVRLRVSQLTLTAVSVLLLAAMMATATLGCRRTTIGAPAASASTGRVAGTTSESSRSLASGQAATPSETNLSTRIESDAGIDLDLRHVPHGEREAIRHAVGLIDAGGPFPYPKDGSVFLNLEKRLPVRPRGHYREYTVPTKGVGHRGARRVVAAKNGNLYYTNDHYDSFIVIRTQE